MTTPEPAKPRRKLSDLWGTVPQWLSAAAALGILYLTATGLKAAKPIFENAALREENAQLRLDTQRNQALLTEAKQAVAAQAANTWRYVCSHYTAKAGAVTSPSFALGSLAPEDVARLQQNFPALALQTGADVLRSTDIRDDIDMLPPPEQKRFARMVEDLIKDNGPAMSASIQLGAGSDAAGVRRTREAIARLLKKFLTACTAAATAP